MHRVHRFSARPRGSGDPGFAAKLDNFSEYARNIDVSGFLLREPASWATFWATRGTARSLARQPRSRPLGCVLTGFPVSGGTQSSELHWRAPCVLGPDRLGRAHQPSRTWSWSGWVAPGTSPVRCLPSRCWRAVRQKAVRESVTAFRLHFQDHAFVPIGRDAAQFSLSQG